MTMMKIQELKEYLPQRYPFLLVDRVVEVDLENNCIEAYKNVSGNEDFFNGHFPHDPIMPGVLIIEAMAQSAGILGFKMIDKQPEDNFVYLFASADKVKFKQPVVPGDKLVLKTQFVREKRDIWKFSCRAEVDGKLAACAEITCAKREL